MSSNIWGQEKCNCIEKCVGHWTLYILQDNIHDKNKKDYRKSASWRISTKMRHGFDVLATFRNLLTVRSFNSVPECPWDDVLPQPIPNGLLGLTVKYLLYVQECSKKREMLLVVFLDELSCSGPGCWVPTFCFPELSCNVVRSCYYSAFYSFECHFNFCSID